MKKVDPLVVVNEQYQLLKERLYAARNAQEKNVILRRLVNLLGVMQFLITSSKVPH
ncbi:hypothetical protein LPW11_18795 [Geomonas sp. RF6]|uniref:hypothetical protein n=1 Tax=Geomonas sp. RF6 TaxID=2897342 RepID=UPI001E60EDF2|nr:hypothetical protein [Geomonas sp. RF6]UFS69922.1 hypothetical protein LPW11_18795 [Geomonas sp. RF6]